jgi:hypothetical protein
MQFSRFYLRGSRRTPREPATKRTLKPVGKMVLPIGRVSGERAADPLKQLGRRFRLLVRHGSLTGAR